MPARRWWLVASLLVVAACFDAGPRAVGAQPSWRNAGPVVAASPSVFAPSGQAVVRYNDPPPPVSANPLGDAVYATVRDAATRGHFPVPTPDARLERACEELAAVVDENSAVPYALVEFALQRNGIVEPSPHLLVVWGDVSAPQAIAEQLAPRLPEYLQEGATRVAVGAVKRKADGTGVVVFALQGSYVTTAPIPRSVPRGGSFPIDAQIDARYHDPEVFVTSGDGVTDRIALHASRLSADPNAFHVDVPCGSQVGRQQVEINGVDARGATVLANFPVWCGTEPPPSLALDSPDEAPISPEAAEAMLLALLNRDREKAGLPALVLDPRDAAVARAHSAEMQRTHVVAHISPTTGSAADRVRAAKINTAVILENVARAYSVSEAHQGLMNSPGHRANMMSSAATHVGIGVVFGELDAGRRELFITQVFTRISPKVDPLATGAMVLGKMVRVRPGILHDPALDVIAVKLANELAEGVPRDTADADCRGLLEQLATKYMRVGSVVVVSAEPSTVKPEDMFGDVQPNSVGIGIAQGPHPEMGDNAVFVVSVTAQTRSNTAHAGE
ncbi:MAG TPA: CAP domain-containing protein [Kofleriaceae bacterium]|jgi:uncharacterized protein YkwD